MNSYDAIVIGAGAGGGVAAQTLAEAGLRVLVLERGKRLDFASTGRDHLRNHRLSQYGVSAGPELEGNPRVVVGLEGVPQVVGPNHGAYQLNASCIGSGTLVYGGQAWRYHPLDFRMASTYGVPEDSSLADWPIDYQELEPYYEWAEHSIGVAGGDPAPQMPARRSYPMPPHKPTKKGQRLAAAAERLGWSTQVVPLLINSQDHDGRPACVNCQHCVGFACPVDAKNGTQNTAIPRALATGNATVVPEAMVLKIKLSDGRATGVSYLADGQVHSAEAEKVFVSCGAIETARLLMISGVSSDALGRNLQGHYYSSTMSLMPEPIWDGVGPGATVATLNFNHGNDGLVGGGMLADDFIVLPIAFAKWHRPPDVPAWGAAFKEWMRYGYRRFVSVMGPVHDIPSPNGRVTLDPWVKDKFGLPVARLSGTTHRETVKVTRFMNERGREWALEAGAEKVWSPQPGLGLSGGQHQAGTCRMGDDPSSSVTDRFGRVHGYENLYLADSSVHVTNGGFNPVLTIMSLARRTAEQATKG